MEDRSHGCLRVYVHFGGFYGDRPVVARSAYGLGGSPYEWTHEADKAIEAGGAIYERELELYAAPGQAPQPFM